MAKVENVHVEFEAYTLVKGCRNVQRLKDFSYIMQIVYALAWAIWNCRLDGSDTEPGGADVPPHSMHCFITKKVPYRVVVPN